LFATFFKSELNFFLLSFATTTRLIRLQELKKQRVPDCSTSKSSSGLLQISDVAIGTLDDCYTVLLGDKTLRGACRSKRLALVGGTSPLMAHFGWPTLVGRL
jgi:hypothetical protein